MKLVIDLTVLALLVAYWLMVYMIIKNLRRDIWRMRDIHRELSAQGCKDIRIWLGLWGIDATARLHNVTRHVTTRPAPHDAHRRNNGVFYE